MNDTRNGKRSPHQAMDCDAKAPSAKNANVRGSGGKFKLSLPKVIDLLEDSDFSFSDSEGDKSGDDLLLSLEVENHFCGAEFARS